METLENYFNHFREKIIGIEAEYTTPYGLQKLIYTDWIASGRLYKDIESSISEKFGPFVANTHTESSETGTRMTLLTIHLYGMKLLDGSM
jgi:selenocysteine lyase/cysteine desulfurase